MVFGSGLFTECSLFGPSACSGRSRGVPQGPRSPTSVQPTQGTLDEDIHSNCRAPQAADQTQSEEEACGTTGGWAGLNITS